MILLLEQEDSSQYPRSSLMINLPFRLLEDVSHLKEIFPYIAEDRIKNILQLVQGNKETAIQRLLFETDGGQKRYLSMSKKKVFTILAFEIITIFALHLHHYQRI